MMEHVEDSSTQRRDIRADRLVFLLTAGILLTTFAIGSTIQTIFVYRPERVSLGELVAYTPGLTARLFANLAAVVAALAAAAAVRLSERRPVTVILGVLAIALTVAAGRHGLQILLGIYDHPAMRVSIVEVGTVAAVIVLSFALGISHVTSRARLRAHVRAEARHRLRASLALAELATEEMRVRRDVADGLHGTLQGRLVLASTTIGSLIDQGREEGWSDSGLKELEELRRNLDRMRERDIRELSHVLYPVGVDVGIGHAVRSLIRKVPSDIDVTAEVSPAADAALEPAGPDELGRRVTLVRGAEEGVTNALRHGGATRIRIAVGIVEKAGRPRIRLTVDDDGVGLPPSVRWGGLARMANRTGLHGGTVALAPSRLGGARLEIEVPITSSGSPPPT